MKLIKYLYFDPYVEKEPITINLPENNLRVIINRHYN